MNRFWLVFKDAPEWYLRFLRPGFRHLWIQGFQDGIFFSVDLGARGIELRWEYAIDWTVIPPPVCALEITERYREAVDRLEAYWKQQGFTAVPVLPAAAGRFAFCGLLTCVGVAKRFLGLRAPWVITPAQLHRHITRWPPLQEVNIHDALGR